MIPFNKVILVHFLQNQMDMQLDRPFPKRWRHHILQNSWATSITNYSKVRKCILRKTGGKCDQTLFCHFGRFEYFATI